MFIYTYIRLCIHVYIDKYKVVYICVYIQI